MILFHDFIQLLKTATCVEDLYNFKVERLIPQIKIMYGYDQQHSAHQYDLWEHSVHTVLNLPKNIDDDMVYLAALLHDIGKPDCQCRGTKESDSNMHYYGHPERSYEIVRDDIIPYLLENGAVITEDAQSRLLYFIKYHDYQFSLNERHIRKHLNMASPEAFRNLLYLQIADANAHILIPAIERKIQVCNALLDTYE